MPVHATTIRKEKSRAGFTKYFAGNIGCGGRFPLLKEVEFLESNR